MCEPVWGACGQAVEACLLRSSLTSSITALLPPQVPASIINLPGLTQLDLSFNRLHTLRPGAYLHRAEIVRLGANEYK